MSSCRASLNTAAAADGAASEPIDRVPGVRAGRRTQQGGAGHRES